MKAHSGAACASAPLRALQREGRELPSELGRLVRSFQAHALEPLVAALGIYEAIVTAMSRSRVRDMKSFGRDREDESPAENDIKSDPTVLRTSAG